MAISLRLETCRPGGKTVQNWRHRRRLSDEKNCPTSVVSAPRLSFSGGLVPNPILDLPGGRLPAPCRFKLPDLPPTRSKHLSCLQGARSPEMQCADVVRGSHTTASCSVTCIAQFCVIRKDCVICLDHTRNSRRVGNTRMDPI